MKLAAIKHHSGLVLSVDKPVAELASVTVTLDAAFRVDVPLDESELRILRDGLDKALAQIAKNR